MVRGHVERMPAETLAKIAETQKTPRTQEKGKAKAVAEVGGLWEAGLGTTREDRRQREAAVETALGKGCIKRMTK